MWLAWGARGEVAGSHKILSSMPTCRVKNKVTGSGTSCAAWWDVLSELNLSSVLLTCYA